MSRPTCDLCGKPINAGKAHRTFSACHARCVEVKHAAIHREFCARGRFACADPDKPGARGHWGLGDIQVIYVEDPKRDIPPERRYVCALLGAHPNTSHAIQDRWGEEPDRPAAGKIDCIIRCRELNGLGPDPVYGKADPELAALLGASAQPREGTKA